jgi:hypothetical protein
MDGRIDPSSALGKENLEGIWSDCSTPRLRTEHHFTVSVQDALALPNRSISVSRLRESPEHAGSKKTIFTEKKEVLLM